MYLRMLRDAKGNVIAVLAAYRESDATDLLCGETGDRECDTVSHREAWCCMVQQAIERLLWRD